MLIFLKSINKEDDIILLADANDNITNQQYGNFVANSELYDMVSIQVGDHETAT